MYLRGTGSGAVRLPEASAGADACSPVPRDKIEDPSAADRVRETTAPRGEEGKPGPCGGCTDQTGIEAMAVGTGRGAW
ncbi:hypothetical protein NDU88_002021 [Pleurodeles waltl]|uniref:Uncharacterized protein n=1 Tax=Pleurodeles waltl TaxID=8319 RepID=A0AAV7NGF9_PLEWA|nr:hypothetical protein NDU88_002021 [Pleurodeles waltl]